MRQCAYEQCNNPIDEDASAKRTFCSDRCRNAAHRAARPVKQVLLTLEDIKEALETFPDQEAIRRLCQQKLLALVKSFPIPKGPDLSIKVPTLTPQTDQVAPQAPPSYLSDPPTLNPQAGEPRKGTLAHYMKYGDGTI